MIFKGSRHSLETTCLGAEDEGSQIAQEIKKQQTQNVQRLFRVLQQLVYCSAYGNHTSD